MERLSDWISEKATKDWRIYAKRLSANDTGQTGSHQSGTLLAKKEAEALFPQLANNQSLNPDTYISMCISSHSFPELNIRAVHYNNKYFDGTRDEYRLTRWSQGFSGSPLLAPDSTGAIAIFAFYTPDNNKNAEHLDVWICDGLEEEKQFEAQVGEVVPGFFIYGGGDTLFGGIVPALGESGCRINLPDTWKELFPAGEEIVAYMDTAFKYRGKTPDSLIVERRNKEYALFRQIEELHFMGKISAGFSTFEEFIQLANSVGNRRKSRSGRSLELHLQRVFKQFGLDSFDAQCITEGRKKPDFIFPSCQKYHDLGYPDQKLRMLGVKTTCKDRWRQILNEADRISQIHLFTLQEGVSVNQFQEMQTEGVSLVVPSTLHKSYPEKIRNDLLSLDGFIKETKRLYS